MTFIKRIFFPLLLSAACSVAALPQSGHLTQTSTTGVNVTQFMSVDMLANPSTVDCSAAFASAFATSRSVYAPAGTYMVAMDIPNGATLIGDGIYSTYFVPPCAGSSVIRVDATSSGRQWIKLSDFSINNPLLLANVTGIEFKGTNVNSINDQHDLNRIDISHVKYGFQISGRFIGCTLSQIYARYCNVGFIAHTDENNVSFIFNTFTNCYFNKCTAEGMRIEKINLSNKFITCNWQDDNQAQLGGVAALYIKDSRSLSLDNCYFEGNGQLDGSPMLVNTTNPAANAIDMWLDGTCITQRPSIMNSYFYGAGTSLYITAVPIYSGHAENNFFRPLPGGFAFAGTSVQVENAASFTFGASNMFDGQVVNSGTNCVFGFEQPKAMTYQANSSGVQPVIDLLQWSKYCINNNCVPINITTINNRLPGCELYIWNVNAAAITIDASLMANGVTHTIAPGSQARFTVCSFPANGKLIPL